MDLIMGLNVPQFYLRQVVYRFSQADSTGYVGGPGLKPVRGISPCGLVKMYLPYHFASSMIGRHLFENRLLSIKHPDTCWSAHLVAREGEKVTIEILDFHGHVRH